MFSSVSFINRWKKIAYFFVLIWFILKRMERLKQIRYRENPENTGLFSVETF
jgi:hypothetical protein